MKNNKIHIIGATISVAGLAVFALEHAFYFNVLDNLTKFTTILSLTLFIAGLVCMLWGTRKSETLRFWAVSVTAMLALPYAVMIMISRCGYFNIRNILVVNRDYILLIPAFAALAAMVAIACLAIRKKLHVGDLPGMVAAAAIVIVACIPRLIDIAGLNLIAKIGLAVITNEDYLAYMALTLTPIVAVVTLPLNQYLRKYRRQTTAAMSLLALAGLIAWNIITMVHAEYYERQRIPAEIAFASGLAFAGVSLLIDLIIPSHRRAINWREFIWAGATAATVSILILWRLYIQSITVACILTMPLCLTAVLYYIFEFFLSDKRKLTTWIGIGTLLLAICVEYMLAISEHKKIILEEDEYLIEGYADEGIRESPVLQAMGDSILSDAIVKSDARYGILLLIDDSNTGFSAISEMTIDSLGMCYNIHREASILFTPQKPLSLLNPIMLGAILDDSVTHNIADNEIADALSSDRTMFHLVLRYYGTRRGDLITRMNEILYNAGGNEVKPFDSLSNNRSLKEFTSGQVVMESPYDILNIYHSIAGDGSNRDVYNDFEENHRLGLPVFAPHTAARILTAMRTNVEKGSLKELAILPIAALKVSTPRIYADENREDSYIVGIFPYDKPQYTCLIMLFDTKTQSKQTTQTLRYLVSFLLGRKD